MDVYTKIANNQSKGYEPPMNACGVVSKQGNLYAIKADNIGYLLPINVNISKYLGKSVRIVFNLSNGPSNIYSVGAPIMLLSIKLL